MSWPRERKDGEAEDKAIPSFVHLEDFLLQILIAETRLSNSSTFPGCEKVVGALFLLYGSSVTSTAFAG